MKEQIADRILHTPPLLFDGAIGSRLIGMGLPAGQAPEAWILSQADKIRQVHEEYTQAGANVITTCSFGGNRIRLKKGSLDRKCDAINRRAVEIAKEASQGKTYIAGGMGPTGEFFQPHGLLTEESADKTFIEQAGILADCSIDFFLLETHYDLKEALISLNACRKTAPSIPVAVTMTFNSTPNGFFTVMGDSAVEALKTLSDNGAFLVGSNCTLEAEGMVKLAKYLVTEIDTPLLIQPNAGTPEITPDGVVYPQKADEFAQSAQQILSSGVHAFGGCCGSDATHISALRVLIDKNFR
ncbi:hypothetical protein CEE37_12865 [candidate division LCP-89 bacterium B3_LCP]|uniref:Hcy-binding domain-containing protein n=1 Tax=candidate division LCP-89 bacterium B3_LCP TaxID=2012998 RepID=A0A532UTY1_UNCL8|nr:MAG: hypothetical protein CEE37_12865 [candidate division LCP-89 bacterium B3_LCP]